MWQSPSHSLCLIGILDLINICWFIQQKDLGNSIPMEVWTFSVHRICSLFLRWKSSQPYKFWWEKPTSQQGSRNAWNCLPSFPYKPEHWHGTQASQLGAPTFLGFNEVPTTPSHTQRWTSYRAHVPLVDRTSPKISAMIQRADDRSNPAAKRPS